MTIQTEKELMKLLITMNKNLVAIGTSLKGIEAAINKLQDTDTHEESTEPEMTCKKYGYYPDE